MIVVGRFGAPFGVKGWMKLQSFTEPTDNIMDYRPWSVELKTGLTPVEVIDSRRHHGGWVILLAGCDNKEETVLYRNASIMVNHSILPKLGANDFYWSDLEGLSVSTTTGQELGEVQYIMPTGANDVLVIKGEQEHLVPYVFDQVIKKVDLDARKILVDWDTDY